MISKKRKKKFGLPHIDYRRERDLCERIKARYFELKNDPLIGNCHILTMLAEEFNAKRPTLIGWQKKWEGLEPDWMPGDVHNYSKEKRIFSDEVEEGVSDYIKENYINTSSYFPDKEFKRIMFQAYNMDDSITRDFHCWPQLIVDFKDRHRFTSRLAHSKKRPDKELTENDINLFIGTIKSIISEANAKNDPVVNADETGWSILPAVLRTWAIKNSKNIVIKAHDDEHVHISAMASITANLEKLPLLIIAKGQDEDDLEEQLGDDIEPNIGVVSKKAYMSTECFIEYLKFLRKQYPEDKKIHLIINSYSSHKAKKAQAIAAELNISLTYIPDGYTDAFRVTNNQEDNN